MVSSLGRGGVKFSLSQRSYLEYYAIQAQPPGAFPAKKRDPGKETDSGLACEWLSEWKVILCTAGELADKE